MRPCLHPIIFMAISTFIHVYSSLATVVPPVHLFHCSLGLCFALNALLPDPHSLTPFGFLSYLSESFLG